MNRARKQRLLLILLLVGGIGLSATLALFALRENINHYYSPSEVVNGQAPLNQTIRGGGLVLKGSLVRDPDSLKVSFRITDGLAVVRVVYEGILPDLFREGQGVVALGQLDNKRQFIAREVLAKHDENYMPPEVQDAIDKAHTQGKVPGEDGYGS